MASLNFVPSLKGREACPAERSEGNEHSESGSPAPGTTSVVLLKSHLSDIYLCLFLVIEGREA
jgi:hypothetical protein